METIKSYLEAMFAGMPNTPEVLKAKDELLQMMDDKYTELIAEGVSENEAVGQVISEFGNLDELSEELNLKKEVEDLKSREQSHRRFVNLNEVKDYLNAERKSALFVAIGVFLCIISSSLTILFSEVIHGLNENIGIGLMFGCIAVAVALFIMNSMFMADYKYLKHELCQIDIATANYVSDKKNDFKNFSMMSKTLGVILCAFCWVPASFTDGSDASCVLMFFMIGVGVLLLIYGHTINKSYELILNLNDLTTISGRYGKEKKIVYSNPYAATLLEVFWPTVNCIYLCSAFLSLNFVTILIIFPIAYILEKILKVAFAKEA
ncbi:MAG: permease prefix domain 1-containing protein [Lachnospiraceae bacterium]|nr:permease prefix domain 1-containing protein [Lachnospiraceae bacterium]